MSYTKLPHNHHNETDHTALLEQLDDIQHFQIVSELFKQLSDPTRIRLFWLLCHCEECVPVSYTHLTLPTTSRV